MAVFFVLKSESYLWLFKAAVCCIGWVFLELFPPVWIHKVMVSSALMDCHIDIDLVHFEIVYVAVAGIWSSKRLFEIRGLLCVPQAILFQHLYDTLQIFWPLSVFWLFGRHCYFSVVWLFRLMLDIDRLMLWLY